AAVAAGSAMAVHGALVTSASIINTVRSGQALWASVKSVATANNARKLERNIERATGQTKPAGYETHHIVPSGSNYDSAREARDVLKNFGIDINDAGNGVFLPREIHNGLANDHRYMEAVLKDLKKATSKDEVIEILQRIGQQLLDGTYPRSGR
ncbi:MAG: AHH domain-containing protein, partial [Candidatus Thermochlorobacter sp.]